MSSEYIEGRIAELELMLKVAQQERKDDPLSVMATVNGNLVIIYVFAIDELEKCLKML